MAGGAACGAAGAAGIPTTGHLIPMLWPLMTTRGSAEKHATICTLCHRCKIYKECLKHGKQRVMAHSEKALLQSWVSSMAVQPLALLFAPLLAPLFVPLLAPLLQKHAEELLAHGKLHQCLAE